MSTTDSIGSMVGKVCVVTGGTQGVGEGAAVELAGRGAEAIVIAGRNSAQGERVRAQLEATGATAMYVPTDLSLVSDCQSLIRAADERFGRIDCLVNAAGNTARGTILSTSAEEFDAVFAVNVRAPFLLMQGAIEIMQREGIAGTIVNVSSATGDGGPHFLAAYGPSKSALNALTKNVAFSVMRTQIRVNAVLPGWIDTPNEHAMRANEGAPSDWLEKAEAGMPFGRLIQVAELSRMIGFLASGESGVMTGSVVHYDQSVPGAGRPSRPSWEETVRREHTN